MTIYLLSIWQTLWFPEQMRFVGINREIYFISWFFILGFRNIVLLLGLVSMENMLNL